MIVRIKNFEILPDFMLRVEFDDGKIVLYDVKDNIRQIPEYIDLQEIYGLFRQARLDSSRSWIVWNENIDLPADVVYEYGQVIHSTKE